MTLDVQAIVAEIAEHYRALEEALDPAAAEKQGGGRSKPESRPPVNLGASDGRARVDAVVDDVALRLRETLGLPHRAGSPRLRWVWRTYWPVLCRLEVEEERGTLLTLRAIPALADAAPPPVATLAAETLEDLRRETRSTLGLDPRPVRLVALCPECQGVRAGEDEPEPRPSLLADADAGRVWCSNRDCGYRCGHPDCWCAPDDARYLHRYRWGPRDLLRLGLLVEGAGR